MAAKTLYDKLWDAHVVRHYEDGTALIYIDRHLLHEVTSPQAFEGLKLAGRTPWRLDANLAVSDHNVPTIDRKYIRDPISRLQLETLDANCREFGIPQFSIQDIRQGIVHVIGPEQGFCLPGMTVVCGDSHTSTNGALGALAFGIGTSEVEHVLASQCLILKRSKNLLVQVDGQLGFGVTAKDLILAIIGAIGTAGGTGYTIEFAGEAIRALSMEARMTVCNMSIEAGARAGLIAVDDTTLDYVKGRPFAPHGEMWERAVAAWRELHSDREARFDREVSIDGSTTLNRGHAAMGMKDCNFCLGGGRPRRLDAAQEDRGTLRSNSSPRVQGWSVSPAAMAGVRSSHFRGAFWGAASRRLS
jgi:3-isopropylmalate/(R)-2-methylmalate dehydratase large subunit